MKIETGKFRDETFFGKDAKNKMEDMRVEEVFHCRKTGITELDGGAWGPVYIFPADRKKLMAFWTKLDKG